MNQDWAEAAEQMVRRQLQPRGVRDPAVLQAMRTTPRHRFIPDQNPLRAYGDHALPTAEGQTISQPFVVARMTELLDIRPGHRVLEVGTGSGYQAAILLKLGAKLVTVERSARLGARADRLLRDLFPDAGDDLLCLVGDGSLGHPPAAPYDRIIVTAASPALPAALAEQLAPNGRLLIPLGDRMEQTLACFERVGDELQKTDDTPCRFVPLVGAQGFEENESNPRG